MFRRRSLAGRAISCGVLASETCQDTLCVIMDWPLPHKTQGGGRAERSQEGKARVKRGVADGDFLRPPKAKMMIDGDFELFFNFDLEFLNNRWANPAQTRAQSASSSLFRGRATAKRCGNDKEVVERVKNMNHFSFGDLPAKSAECPPPPTPWSHTV